MTLGLGAEADAGIEIDFHNIAWGAANAFWILLNEVGFKNKGKKWLIPVEENTEMCLVARNQLFKMMGEVYRENENKVKRLEYWDLLERRVSALPRPVA
ncbi:MAG: hypothetical protein ACI9OJ_005405 [Myxococcota bacterium]